MKGAMVMRVGWLMWWALACVCWVACGKGQPASHGGESNWLRSCDSDDECGSLDCLCGVCTRACGDGGGCEGDEGPAACTQSEALIAPLCAPVAEARPGGLCLATCEDSQACGPDQVCLLGQCMVAVQAQVLLAGDGSLDVTSGSAPDAGPGRAMPAMNGQGNLGALAPGFGYNETTGCWELGPSGVAVAEALPGPGVDLSQGALELEGMHTLIGDLTILRADAPETLDQVRCLKQVVGHVHIGPRALSTSDGPWRIGFERLESISGDLIMDQAHGAELELPNLQSIGGSLRILNSASPVDLGLFSALSFVGDEVEVSGNASIADCDAEALAARVGRSCVCEANLAPCER